MLASAESLYLSRVALSERKSSRVHSPGIYSPLAIRFPKRIVMWPFLDLIEARSKYAIRIRKAHSRSGDIPEELNRDRRERFTTSLLYGFVDARRNCHR